MNISRVRKGSASFVSASFVSALQAEKDCEEREVAHVAILRKVGTIADMPALRNMQRVAGKHHDIHLGMTAILDEIECDGDAANRAIGIAPAQRDLVALGEASEAASLRDCIGNREVLTRLHHARANHFATNGEAIAIDLGYRDGDLGSSKLYVLGQTLCDLFAKLAWPPNHQPEAS